MSRLSDALRPGLPWILALSVLACGQAGEDGKVPGTDTGDVGADASADNAGAGGDAAQDAAVASGGSEAEPVATTQPEQARLPRLLVYTVSAGYEHAVVKRPSPEQHSVVERAMATLAQRTGAFEAVISRDAVSFEPEALAEVDGVFFYTTGELPLNARQRDALLAFVANGGAFTGSHCATDTFYEVPEFGRMLGGYFDGHPWHEEVGVTVEVPDHPATRGLGEAFRITDEIYQFKAPYSRERQQVLLSLDTSSVDMTKAGIHRTDGDFAVSWTREHGRGRVFYTSLGHRPEVWADPRFQSHLIGGITWALETAGTAGSSDP